MFIWSGLGILGIIVMLISVILTQTVMDNQYGDGFYSDHPWAIGVAVIIGGILNFVLGMLLKRRTDKKLVDPETGEEVVVNRSNHSIFFIPIHIFGVLMVLLGIYLIAKDLWF